MGILSEPVRGPLLLEEGPDTKLTLGLAALLDTGGHLPVEPLLDQCREKVTLPQAVLANVRQSVRQLRCGSPDLEELIDKGDLTIVGAKYALPYIEPFNLLFMRMLITLAVFLVYLVMASQFESLVHPFVILFTIPLALVGAACGDAAAETTTTTECPASRVSMTRRATSVGWAVKTGRTANRRATEAISSAGTPRSAIILAA